MTLGSPSRYILEVPTNLGEKFMKLYEFTTVTGDDDALLVLVSGRIADHREPTAQKEWITFQIAIDEPTVRNGAILRSKVLGKTHEILLRLSQHFEQLARYHAQ
jgi:hypothetical protein